MVKLAVYQIMLIASVMLASRMANASLTFCNKTEQEVYVALGWSDANNNWHSSGWYILQPQECNSVISGKLSNRWYYYYAKSGDLSLLWDGSQDPNSGLFCTKDERFDFSNTGAPCEGKKFQSIDIGTSVRVDFTLNLNP